MNDITPVVAEEVTNTVAEETTVSTDAVMPEETEAKTV